AKISPTTAGWWNRLNTAPTPRVVATTTASASNKWGKTSTWPAGSMSPKAWLPGCRNGAVRCLSPYQPTKTYNPPVAASMAAYPSHARSARIRAKLRPVELITIEPILSGDRSDVTGRSLAFGRACRYRSERHERPSSIRSDRAWGRAGGFHALDPRRSAGLARAPPGEGALSTPPTGRVTPTLHDSRDLPAAGTQGGDPQRRVRPQARGIVSLGDRAGALDVHLLEVSQQPHRVCVPGRACEVRQDPPRQRPAEGRRRSGGAHRAGRHRGERSRRRRPIPGFERSRALCARAVHGGDRRAPRPTLLEGRQARVLRVLPKRGALHVLPGRKAPPAAELWQ